MAREYPRFLFSNPQNTKSKGPFIVHLLEPRLVFKVVSYSKLVCLDMVYDTNEAEKIQADALKWFQSQHKKMFIEFENGSTLEWENKKDANSTQGLNLDFTI